MSRIQPYKFVKWEAGEQVNIVDGNQFVRALFSKGKFTFGLDNVMSSGIYRIHGWAYDLRPYLKRYWYSQYGSIHQAFAPTQELLRKATYGRIDKIQEVG